MEREAGGRSFALANVAMIALLWPLALVSAVAARLDTGQASRLGRFLRKAELDRLSQRLFRLG